MVIGAELLKYLERIHIELKIWKVLGNIISESADTLQMTEMKYTEVMLMFPG